MSLRLHSREDGMRVFFFHVSALGPQNQCLMSLMGLSINFIAIICNKLEPDFQFPDFQNSTGELAINFVKSYSQSSSTC